MPATHTDALTAHAATIDGVLQAAVPSFDGDHDPVRISSYALPTLAEVGQLRDRCAVAGFAVFEAAGRLPEPGDVVALAHRLGLGEPFRPPLLAGRPGQLDDDGVTTLTAAVQRGSPASAHPAFGSSVGQRIHSDGTLQRIGEITTSVLICRSPAAHGGESILFNSTGAFKSLAACDPAAALALMGDRVLVRTANINACTDSVPGPAFALAGGRLVSRYSVTATDTYDPDGGDAAALDRGRVFLLHHEHPGSPFYRELRLTAGQGLVLANDRIGHGRRPFTDGPDPRVMFRALFTTAMPAQTPRIGAVWPAAGSAG